MSIQTVRDNLISTIAGKEKLYESYAEELNAQYRSTEKDSVIKMATVLATREYLKINIDELKRILQDVEQCVPKEPEFDENDSEEVRNLIRMGRWDENISRNDTVHC